MKAWVRKVLDGKSVGRRGRGHGPRRVFTPPPWITPDGDEDVDLLNAAAAIEEIAMWLDKTRVRHLSYELWLVVRELRGRNA